MLCGKTIITNENRDKIRRVLSLENSKLLLEQSKSSINLITDENVTEEILYEVCCDLAEFISKAYVAKDIYRYIEKNYSCFNADEKKIICSHALNCEQIGELPGRIYIFLKSENSINLFGFYKLMCTDIVSAVNDAVTEEAERLVSLNDTEDFIELLKYFAAMSPVSSERVDIVAKKCSIKIVNSADENTYNAEFASLDPMPEDILSELVALNPKKIVVHGKEFYEKSEFSLIINSVFKDRIFYCTGCSLCENE